MDVHPGEDRWQQLIIDTSRESAIRLGNGALDNIAIEVDGGGKTATFTDPDDPAWKCDFNVARPDSNKVQLNGRINGVDANVVLHRVPPEKLRLLRSRFRWTRTGS